MTSGWHMRLVEISRRLWVRATLYSVLAVATALVAIIVGPYLPEGLEAKIGADAVDSILNIIATSMLAVSTFSLSTMVAAYASATSSVTPRATKLLIEDATSQRVLATFIGSFLYSLVGIVALTMGVYGDEGRVVLFVVTIGVILLIVGTLLRWVDHLTRLGRVNETTAIVEKATAKAIRGRLEAPFLGGVPLTGDIPVRDHPLVLRQIGYLRFVDMAALSAAAEKAGAAIYLAAVPGKFNNGTAPLAYFDRPIDDPSSFAAGFVIGDERSFDQDPRFGLCVLAEIAQRALSPGINDPGTAIDVIGRGVRTLAIWSEEPNGEPPKHGRVHVPPVLIEDCFDDFFPPIARDGARMAEVCIRLQKALAALAALDERLFGAPARLHSAHALEWARTALELDVDREAVAAAALR